MTKLNLTPSVIRGKHYLSTIANIVGQLLVREEGDVLAFGKRGVSVNHHAEGLSITACDAKDDNNMSALCDLLRGYFLENHPELVNVVRMEGEPSPGHGRLAKRYLVINHEAIPCFLNEICHAVSLYKDKNYSLVRDFYNIRPEGGAGLLAEAEANALRAAFQQHHKAYSASEKTQTRVYGAAHWANGAKATAPLFKKAHHSVSSEDELYQRLNALIHAYHLQDAQIGEKVLDDFHDKITEKDERIRVADVYDDDFFTMIEHGDMFYEISEQFKKNPDVELAYVSPDNLFRCGSAALTGNRGTVEECLARVSSYVPRGLAEAEVHQDDPQTVLYHLYKNRQPTGSSVKLSAACGVYYLAGQTIPEYITREDVRAYSEFAYERLHLAREMAGQADYEDKYPLHKTMPHFVPDVHLLDAQGKVRRVGVLGMVGIDGKARDAGSIASQIGFSDTDLQDKNDRDDKGNFSFFKTIDFYKAQWRAAFEEIIRAQNPEHRQDKKVFILNPVGCGAFDPSKDGSMYTKASAQGFSEALLAYKQSLKDANIQLVLPVYDMKKVWPHYKDAVYAALRTIPKRVVIGGTSESCQEIIHKKYLELSGKKFDIEHKTLEEILAHAIQKDGKTRHALITLGYLALKADNTVVLGALAPGAVRVAFDAVKDCNSKQRIKERIIQQYKAVRGFIYKDNHAKKDAFDIFSANLEAIIAHAELKEGNTRHALIKLNYFHMEGKRLVLNTYDVPAPVVDAFNARHPVPAPQLQAH